MIRNLENVKKEDRPSNLVRINTDTKWSQAQLDILEQQLRDELSKLKNEHTHVQNGDSHNMHAQPHENVVNHTQGVNGLQNAMEEQLTLTNVTAVAMPMNNREEKMRNQNVELKPAPKIEVLEQKNNFNEMFTNVVTAELKQREPGYQVREINSTDHTVAKRLRETDDKELLLIKPEKNNQKLCGSTCDCVVL